MTGWRSLNEWSPEWLKNSYGDVEVHTSLNIPERGDDFSYWGSDVRWMPLAQFVDHMKKSDQPCYTRQAPSNLFPDFNAYFDFDDFLNLTSRSATTGLWFGSNGTDSGLHWDTDSNFLAQIYGRKKAVLFPPSCSKYLYPYRDQIRWTPFNAFAPDFEQFPKARYATPHIADLNPGEAIHIPRGWWHQFISNEVAISINCFFQPSCGLRHFIKSAAHGGPLHVARLIRDFVVLGLFKSQQDSDTVSDIPTGQFVYDIVSGAIARRLTVGSSQGKAQPLPAGSDKIPTHSIPGSRRSLRVLVADNHQVNQELLSSVLHRAGHVIDIVDSGQEALEAVVKKAYDVVLMDVQMSTMDGIKAVKKIRELAGPQSEIPIIALTAEALKGELLNFFEIEMNELASKPGDPESVPNFLPTASEFRETADEPRVETSTIHQ